MKQGKESQPAENNNLEQTETIRDSRKRDPRVYSPRKKHQALIGTLGIMAIVSSGCIPNLSEIPSIFIPKPARAEEPAGKQARKATADYTSLPRLVDKCAVTHPVGRPDIRFLNQIMKIVEITFPNLTAQQTSSRQTGISQYFSSKLRAVDAFEQYFINRPVAGEIKPGVTMAAKNLDQYSGWGELIDEIRPQIPTSNYAFDGQNYVTLAYTVLDFIYGSPISAAEVGRTTGPYGEIGLDYSIFMLQDSSQIAALRHEMGHAKGMPHNTNSQSVMNPFVFTNPDAGFTEQDINGVCESGLATSTATATATIPAQATATATPTPTKDPLPNKVNLPLMTREYQYPPKPANAQISQEYKYRPVNTPTPTPRGIRR